MKVNSTPASAGTDDDISKQETMRISLIRARLEFMGKRTSECFDHCLAEFREDANWPWTGTTRSSRVAPDYLAKLFRGGQKAFEHITAWVQLHGLQNTEEGEQMLMIAVVLDHMLLHDRISMLNASSVEILSRRFLGLQKSLENVWKASQIKERKTDRLRWYDLVHFDPMSVSGVDKEVREEMKAESDRLKYGHKHYEAEGLAAP
jgi:hypothetical protein